MIPLANNTHPLITSHQWLVSTGVSGQILGMYVWFAVCRCMPANKLPGILAIVTSDCSMK